ncbi:hypothetical protein WKK05_32650 [Nostoc sp. UHCC 0302]|uniref:hypothetical protein n=1 Tax=Nostoc sp. UHCC 0302 TaxID=3134896 RepID=UPI00311CCA7C
MNTLKTKLTKLPVVCGVAALMTLNVNMKATAVVLYDVTDIDSFINKYSSTPTDINDSGQVGGYWDASGEPGRGFLWSNSNGVTNLATLPSWYNSIAFGINNASQVVGFSTILDSAGAISQERPVLWSNNTITDLGTLPGWDYTRAIDINDAGQIAGYSYGMGGSRALLWSNNTITDLGTLPGDNSSHAFDLNDTGQILGDSSYVEVFTDGDGKILYSASGVSRPVLWNNNSITDLSVTLPGKSVNATAINNAGQIAGSVDSQQLKRTVAALWTNNHLTPLGTLEGKYENYAVDLNDVGQVVGNANGSTSVIPFVWSSNTGMRNLNTLIDPSQGWKLLSANAINNEGQIVVYGYKEQDFKGRALLLTPRYTEPVPEPWTIGSTVLAGFGLASLSYRQRRLRRYQRLQNN